LEASFSGLCVVCGSCLVASSGFMERRPICPENAGAQWKKRGIVPHRHHPVLLLRPGRPAVPLQRAHFAGGAVAACHLLPGDCISQARNGRGIKKTAFKPPGKQPVGLLGACALNPCQWHGAGRAKWPFLRCGTPFRPPTALPARAHKPNQAPNPTQPSTPARARTAWNRPGTRAPGEQEDA
jgi:hypothetical protein